ncbi:MAG: hypothetical protein AAB538_05600 [Patescibacteria group bacterium]
MDDAVRCWAACPAVRASDVRPSGVPAAVLRSGADLQIELLRAELAPAVLLPAPAVLRGPVSAAQVPAHLQQPLVVKHPAAKKRDVQGPLAVHVLVSLGL